MSELPEWIKPGADVFEATTTRFGGVNYRLQRATVERITKTQIVLDNGNRYRVETLKKIEPRDSARIWSPTPSLKDPASPEMHSELELHKTEKLRTAALDAMDAVRKNTAGVESINQAVFALMAYRDRL